MTNIEIISFIESTICTHVSFCNHLQCCNCPVEAALDCVRDLRTCGNCSNYDSDYGECVEHQLDVFADMRCNDWKGVN